MVTGALKMVKSTQEIEKGDCWLKTVKVPRREKRVTAG